MMRELTAFEIENVSGAGWLQDGLAALGSKVGAAAWTMGTDALTLTCHCLAPSIWPTWRRTWAKPWAKALGRLSAAPSKVRWQACR